MTRLYVQWDEGHYCIVPKEYANFYFEATEAEERQIEHAIKLYNEVQRLLSDKERKSYPCQHSALDQPCERDNQNRCHYCGRDMSDG